MMGFATSPAAQAVADPAFSRLWAQAGVLGITRIADLTGLDTIGFPVAQAVRPFSLSNSVSQGKGEHICRAAVGALMEAVEGFCAERLDRFETVVATARELGSAAADLGPHHLCDAASDAWRDEAMAWTAGENLITGKMAYLPLEMVHTAYTPAAQPAYRFVSTTTGLAAHFSEDQAIMHGILECVERDAIARAKGVHGFFQHNRVSTSSLADGLSGHLLSLCKRAGVLAAVWLAPSPTGIPVAWAHAVDDPKGGAVQLAIPSEGSASGASAALACRDALAEAVQSRTTAIAATRDDFTRLQYPRFTDHSKIETHQRLLMAAQGTLTAKDDPVFTTLDALLAQLHGSGFGALYCVRLDVRPLAGVHVVKIVIPALLPLEES